MDNAEQLREQAEFIGIRIGLLQAVTTALVGKVNEGWQPSMVEADRLRVVAEFLTLAMEDLSVLHSSIGGPDGP